MREEIYAMAAALTSPTEQEQQLLTLLCQAEEKKLEALLGEQAEEWQETFLCAAAFLSAAALLESRAGEGAESFTVGDVTINRGNGGSGAARLREQASRLLANCGLGGDGFAFLEVRG